jgi:Zn-dependent M28 family amino/carboxypeptidase
MKDKLSNIVKKLAIQGFRRAGGNSWETAMSLMHVLISEQCREPEIEVWKDDNGITYRNFSLFFKGKNPKKIVIGAHYDSFEETPGADDNASAVAVLLCLAGELKNVENLPFDTELIFYACEEPPFFGSDAMGSFHHAQSCNNTNTAFMICLEMVGYFSDKKGSQSYPLSILRFLYGSRGNYLMLVSDMRSRAILGAMRKSLSGSSMIYKRFVSPFKSWGMDWSDHRNYWSKKIPAIMITDTSLFRNKNYHELTDLPDTLNYEKMAILVNDLVKIVKNIKLR